MSPFILKCVPVWTVNYVVTLKRRKKVILDWAAKSWVSEKAWSLVWHDREVGGGEMAWGRNMTEIIGSLSRWRAWYTTFKEFIFLEGIGDWWWFGSRQMIRSDLFSIEKEQKYIPLPLFSMLLPHTWGEGETDENHVLSECKHTHNWAPLNL